MQNAGLRYRFDRFTLDLAQGCLLSDNQSVELRPKSFEVLRHLVENSGRLVSKDELLDAIWPNVCVSDGSLKQCVSEVRHALGDDGRIIRTMPRRGYLFAVPMSVCADDLEAAAQEAELVHLRIPDRPSIAVLPFVNISRDPQDEVFSDGISEDLITGISRFSDLFVIARASVFAYKGSSLSPGQIGRELGVRYLLYGSVRRHDQQLRMTAQLVEAQTGKQLWAERYERALVDVFAIQDDLTEKIVGSMVANINKSEIARASRKRPQSLSAYDLYLRGKAAFRDVTQPNRGQVIVDTRALYQQSIAADLNYAAPIQGLANNYVFSYLEPTKHDALKGEYRQQPTLDRALALARQAVQLDPTLPEAYATLAWTLHWNYRRSEGIAEFERAFALNPNLADGRYSLMLAHNGRAAKGISIMKRMMRLDPFHPPLYFGWLGNAHYLLGQYAQAYQALKVAAARQPEHRPSYVWLAAVAAQLGRNGEAKITAAQVMMLEPDFTISRWLRLLQLAKQADADRLAEGLRKAGLPE
jgi:adenylate cyclase